MYRINCFDNGIDNLVLVVNCFVYGNANKCDEGSYVLDIVAGGNSSLLSVLALIVCSFSPMVTQLFDGNSLSVFDSTTSFFVLFEYSNHCCI